MRCIYLKTIIIIFILSTLSLAQIPKTISYQGVLTNNAGEPMTGEQSLTFKLYVAASEGNMLWEETQTVSLADGLFNVILGSKDPLDLPFNQPYWLGITVGSGNELAPRIQLTASPYSINTLSVSDSSITAEKLADGSAVKSIIVGSDTLKNDVIFKAGNNISLAADGNRMTISATSRGEADADWNISGNNMSSVVSGNVGIGTDNPGEKLDVAGNARINGEVKIDDPGTIDRITAGDTLEMYIGDQRILRIEPAQHPDFGFSPNIIIGSSTNNVLAGIYGATIGGGRNNEINGDLSTTVFNGVHATISGGSGNLASGLRSTVSGGGSNTASGFGATVSGGDGNDVSGSFATISGGQLNSAGGNYATIAGGFSNSAEGDYSFAAGQGAKANHEGTFVWSDVRDLPALTSTGKNQFLIRASGGVGINTNSPAEELDVFGTTRITNDFNGAVLLDLNTERNWQFRQLGSGSATALELAIIGGGGNKNFIISNDGDGNSEGNVGIGTTNPQEKLHVDGKVLADAHITPSSRRWKTNIHTLEDALDKVLHLRGVSYDWKADGKHDIGLIAEEVGQVIPEVVEYEPNGVDAKSVDYPRLVAVFIEAIKEQQQQIEALREALHTEENELSIK